MICNKIQSKCNQNQSEHAHTLQSRCCTSNQISAYTCILSFVTKKIPINPGNTAFFKLVYIFYINFSTFLCQNVFIYIQDDNRKKKRSIYGKSTYINARRIFEYDRFSCRWRKSFA